MDHHSTFRSVLPHEPLPQEELGYLQIQGAFQPAKKNQFQWTSSQELQDELLHSFQFQNVTSVTILDAFTKIRLVYKNPTVAQHVMYDFKERKLSPSDLFSSRKDVKFSHRPLQVTQVTTCALPQVAWPRSNPPKFRRLSNNVLLQKTRFVYCNGLLDDASHNEDLINHVEFVHSIRALMNKFDTSGLGVEVFLSKKTFRYCHVGMRSNKDAQQLVAALQGKVVPWEIHHNAHNSTITSETLFLDYAQANNNTNTIEKKCGEPSRSECTSTTASVKVPGLVLVENFVSKHQQEALMAVLMGPHAPWAPSQTTPSAGVVKRRVQHYGYVFDYQTANVLRDRTTFKGNCPPLPGLSETTDASTQELNELVETYTAQGRGWNVLAGTLEQVRRYEFATDPSLSFPDINQMTVNEYVPGQGIGSHIDTSTLR